MADSEAQIEDINVAQSEGSNVAESGDISVALSGDIGVAQSEDKDVPVPQSEDSDVAESGDSNVAQNRDSNVAQGGDSKVPQSEDSDEALSEDSDVAQSEDRKVAQSGGRNVAQRGDSNVAQSGEGTIEVAPRKPTVHILVVSDVVCPWCWIAKRRLENAMDSLQDKLSFDVQFSPFLLRPSCPPEGVPNPDCDTESLRAKHLRAVGDNLDLELNLSCPIVPCSVPALTLRQYVRESDRPNAVQNQVTEKLYEAHFTKGLALTRDDLMEIAGELQLDVDEVTAYLDDPKNQASVLEQAESWRNQGVQAVPFFFMNGKAACSGAQTTGDFVKTILKVAERFPENTMEKEEEA